MVGEASELKEASEAGGLDQATLVRHEAARLAFIRDLGLDRFEEDVVIHPVVEMCQRLCRTPVALFTVLGTEHQYFCARSGTKLTHTPREFAFCNEAVQASNPRVPYVVVDASRHPKFRINPLVCQQPHIRFYLGLPVLTPAGIPIGAICLIDYKPRLATAEMVEALSLARDIVERELLQRTQAQVDALTGVLMRREVDKALERELRRVRRQRALISVMMIDIDNFKAINDEFGHLHGDEALRQTAAAIDGCLNRAGDAVGRWGGEEFICVAPSISQDNAQQLAERIRQRVADTVSVSKNGRSKRVTVSIGGVTAVGSGLFTALSLIGAADTALYAAKRAGRNRCVFAPMIGDQTDARPVSSTASAAQAIKNTANQIAADQ